jgi:hypothetical protein
MTNINEKDLLHALSHAITHLPDVRHGRILSDFILERDPESLRGWLHRASLDRGNKKKIDDLTERIRRLDRAGRSADESFVTSCEKCAEFLAPFGDWQVIIEMLQYAMEVAPSRCSSLRWKLVAAHMALGQVDQAREAAAVEHTNPPFPLGDFANQALLALVMEKDGEKGRAILEGLEERNPYLVEFLRGQKRIPAVLPKRPKHIYVGSRYEALLYLEYGWQSWTQSIAALFALFGQHSSLPASQSESLTAPIELQKEPPTLDEIRKTVDSFVFSTPDQSRGFDVVKNPKLWAQFFALAERWYNSRVWETVGKEDRFFMSLEPLGKRFVRKEPPVISTMGALGGLFGVYLFDSYDDVTTLTRAEGANRVADLQEKRSFSSVTLEFLPNHEVHEVTRCLTRAFGIEPIGTRKVVPQVSRIRAGIMPNLPVEGRLLELMAAIETSLRIHDDIKAGGRPWSKVSKDKSLITAIPCPNLTPWADRVDIKEFAAHPQGAVQRFDQVGLIRALTSVSRCKGTWEVSWHYTDAYVRSDGENPTFVPVILLLVDRESRHVLSHQLGRFGQSLVNLLANALVKAVADLGYKPERLHVKTSVASEVIAPLLKSAGIELSACDNTKVADAVIREMITHFKE